MVCTVVIDRVYKVRGERPFHIGQRKSGKLAMVRAKMPFFIITEVFDLFCLHLKFILL